MKSLGKLFNGFLIALIVIAAFLGASVDSSSDKESFTVLWVWGPPFPVSNVEFSVFKSLLSSHNVVIVYKAAWEFSVGQGVNWSLWLEGAGYDLVVVSWYRAAYRDALRSFLEECFRVGVPVLLLPSSGWDLFEPYGLGMSGASLFNVNFSVVEDELTGGVLVSGVRGSGVVAVFRPLNVSGGWNVSWRPLVLGGDGGAVAVVGWVGGSRVAGFAPYFYADESYDNRVLFENVLFWLLGGWLTEEGEGVVGDWGSVAVRDLAEVRARLLEELRVLEAERNRTLEELWRLRNEMAALNATLNTTVTVTTTATTTTTITNTATTTVTVGGNQTIVVDARKYYRLTGIGAALGVVAGYLLAVGVARRRSGEGGGGD